MKQLRQIIRIDRDKCNGCGQCVKACHEGALQIKDGKAVLVADHFCDGLGDCIGECPQGALTFETREAQAFDAAAVAARHNSADERHGAGNARGTETGEGKLPCGCPGTLARKLDNCDSRMPEAGGRANRLQNWPVQLQLVPVNAPYLKDAELVLAAHCSAFAIADFHEQYLGPDKVLAIACPKLDDAEQHVEKLARLLAANELFGITVVRMEVPCCGGLQRIAEQAIARSGKNVPLRVKTINIK